MTAPNSNSQFDPSPASGFTSQSQMGLAEVIQMCCLSRRSGQITFRSGESYGYVFIQQGRVLHAMCGVVEGEEAIYLMLSWPGGGFTLDEDIIPHKKTITLTWEQLLFEGARRADIGMITRQTGPSSPILTASPVTSSLSRENQPKLIITVPGADPTSYDLDDEYTHVGRSAGNEIALPYPSISNRHCIFIVSGPDIVVRDLNSSNGTYVNGHVVSEAVLLPGDVVQIGVAELKFEPGIKRPKLSSDSPAPVVLSEAPRNQGRAASLVGTLKRPTVRLDVPRGDTQPTPRINDSVYVKGESAISYKNLAVPAPKKKNPWITMVIGVVIFLVILGLAYVFLLEKR